MTAAPFILNFDAHPFFDHNIFPNHMYRRQHARHHDPLTFDTMGMMARLWPHSKHLIAKRNGDLEPLNRKKNEDFEIHLDVGLFQPEEITVKLNDNCIVIEGKHEEREDEHGHISRHFTRRYTLPEGSNLEQIASTLTTDGVLTVKVPQIMEEKKAERIIQIQQIGPSDLFIKNGNNATVKDTKSTLTDNNCKSDKGNNTDTN